MTKSISELFAYISNPKFNQGVFESSIKDFISHKGNINDNPNKITLLGAAAEHLNTEAINILLAHDANPDALTLESGTKSTTPL